MIISFVVPAYNARRYLHQTIRSLLAQTGGRKEILLVDDGSTDDTFSIAREYAQRYSCIRLIHTENRGVSHARNVGIAAARGRYIAFLDADDVLCSDAYTPQLEAFLAASSYDLISFGYIASDHRLKYGKLVPEQNRVLSRKDPEFLRQANNRHFSARLYRRELLQELRFFEGIRYGEDSVFAYLAFHRARNAVCFDKYWFLYRNNIHSAIHNTGGWQYILTDCVTAWARAARTAQDSSGQWDCWGMVYSTMGQYLRLSAMAGVPLQQLKGAMDSSDAFQDALSRYGSFWTRPETDRLLQELDRAPRRTWLKYRLKGVIPNAAMHLSRTFPLRHVYFRLKYRTSLDGFLSAPTM